MISKLFIKTFVFSSLAGILLAQAEIESFGVYGDITKYPAEWPAGPPASSVPDWAKPGRIRFTRWDGGPIETAKAFLSGWPGFNPPVPDYLYVMTNWYDTRTAALLREASYNVIWVTFSNGFSIPTEHRQRELLGRYIDECHRQGIRVVAYQSVGNMFWEDMYEQVPDSRNWVEVGKDGKPVPYSAGIYQKMGRITRYMANLSNPAWREYLKKRIDLAIDAGADAIMYDNCFSPYLGATFQEIQRYASSRKKDMLIMANFHKSDFIFNRLINSITTEEGGEAGVFTEANLLNSRFKPEHPFLLRVGDGLLVNNIGRFRIFQNLSQGWKPVNIESRLREVGIPETHIMSAERQQLVLGENMMFSTANETFVEGTFAYNLWHRDPQTVNIWRAIGTYNRFQADNELYYTDTHSMASVAIVLDNRSEPVAYLNGLASRNVIYDVLYEHQLTPESLRPYAAVALVGAQLVRDRAVAALEEYVTAGGRLFAVGKAATHDLKGMPRPRPAFFGRKTGKGDCTYYEKIPPVDELAGALLAADRTPIVRVIAPPGVLYNYVAQPKQGRIVVHLLNYTLRPTQPIKVALRGNFADAKLFTPDSPRALARVTTSSGSSTELEVTGLKIYSILVLEKKEMK